MQIVRRVVITSGFLPVNPIVPKKSRLCPYIQRAQSHILKIPYNHLPYVKFDNGIPTKHIREIKPWELAAGYGRIWSTSEDKSILPKCSFFTIIPENEVWIMKRKNKFSRALRGGLFFIMPFFEKVQALKTPYQVVSGVFASCVSSGGKKIDVYAVLYFKWTDFEKAAFYQDVERDNCDAERSLQYITIEAMANEASKNVFKGDGEVDPEVKRSLLDKIHEKHSKYTSKYGMEVLSVELRGAWDAELNVPYRLYSLDPEAPRPDAFGDNLSNDYWGDSLDPNFFYRYTYGSEKMITTPAVTSLEWAIPSPPDYHHFNQLPVILMDPEEYKKTGGKFV